MIRWWWDDCLSVAKGRPIWLVNPQISLCSRLQAGVYFSSRREWWSIGNSLVPHGAWFSHRPPLATFKISDRSSRSPPWQNDCSQSTFAWKSSKTKSSTGKYYLFAFISIVSLQGSETWSLLITTFDSRLTLNLKGYSHYTPPPQPFRPCSRPPNPKIWVAI